LKVVQALVLYIWEAMCWCKHESSFYNSIHYIEPLAIRYASKILHTLEETFKSMTPYMVDFVIILNIIWLKARNYNKQFTNKNRPNCNHSICNYIRLLVICSHLWIIFATISCIDHICNYIPINLQLFWFSSKKNNSCPISCKRDQY
jgi:hypothetical protein